VPLLEFHNQLAIALVLVAGGMRAVQGGETNVGDLIGFFFMVNLFLSPISVLGNQFNQAMTAMAGAERVFALLDAPTFRRDPTHTRSLPLLRGHVVFDRVTFAYEPGHPVLRDVCWEAHPEMTVAFVGHTGSGKSSIINLLCQFYQPDEGEIRIDGHNLRQIDPHCYRRQLGLVLQSNFLFQGTVADNIRFSMPAATDQEIWETIERLDFLDLVADLPDGLHTRVGERGNGLSSGQRQWVCFARAMLANPRILLLDEATSSVDPLTESRLQCALTQLLRGRTSFIVAHRLSTIRQADLIIVLDRGRIVEQGRHEDLTEMAGSYARLCQSLRCSAPNYA
jgi:ATP-binding cassette subfamily B protein